MIDMPGKFGGKGKGYEDAPGAFVIQTGTNNPLLDGKPMWHTAIHAVLTTRSQGKCRARDGDDRPHDQRDSSGVQGH